MKTLVFILGVAGGILLILVMTGLYPVALVDGSPIFQRTWKKAQNAAKTFTNAQAQSSRADPIDFTSSENQELLLDVMRGTLTSLIEDSAIRQKGDEVVDGLGVLSRERVADALRQVKDPAAAAKLVYGLSLDDFRELVLLPQARRDVLKEVLKEGGQDFDSWLRDVKGSLTVRLFFVPFRWDGEMAK